jgi:calcineurin-like phosphoesterase family protein
MNKTIIDNCNRVLQSDDLLFILGDFALASKEKMFNVLSQLKVKPYLIFGNHDGSKIRMASVGFQVREDTSKSKDYLIIPERSFGKMTESIILTHRPFTPEIFDFDFYGWNLHGHVHKKNGKMIDPENKRINVNVEFWDYKPVNLTTILEIINHKEFSYVNYKEI